MAGATVVVCAVIAKFHYTGLTGPARTFFAARDSEKLHWVRAGLRQSPCGSGRARVVEFNLYSCSCRLCTASARSIMQKSRATGRADDRIV